MPARKPKPGESFGDLFPEIAKQWHPTKNGDLTPYDLKHGSKLKVWWKCPEGNDHEWEASNNTRSKGTGCPICSNQKVVLSNCLATTHPKISKEWHPTKNIDLTPFDVVAGTGKKVWWKCSKGDDHEWVSDIKSRTTRNSGCSVCYGNKVVLSNSLATTHPKIARELDLDKNYPITSEQINSGSHKEIWWKCKKNESHIWKKMVYDRIRSPNCPMCNSLFEKKPELVKEIHPTKNSYLDPKIISFSSSKIIWWKCDKGEDHEWKAKIYSRSNGRGCPICSGYKVVKSNCLSTTHPKIANEWHPTKNNNLKPNNFTAGSQKIVWWKCDKGEDHEWKASIKSRKVNGCGICSGKVITKSNNLKILNPELVKEWNYSKNKNIKPTELGLYSHKKVWWKCHKDKNHIWEAVIINRSYGSGCPYCDLTPQSKEELIITHELITIFKGIDPKGFKTRVKGKLRSIDIYIPDLKLGIEFDGNYWHKDKRALDKLKTEELEAEGFNIIRVRQKPLKRIFKDDVMADKKYDGKKITNDILTQIMKDYKLGQSTILKINKYIEMPNLQNEKGLEKYIDMILTEKAEKK